MQESTSSFASDPSAICHVRATDKSIIEEAASYSNSERPGDRDPGDPRNTSRAEMRKDGHSPEGSSKLVQGNSTQFTGQRHKRLWEQKAHSPVLCYRSVPSFSKFLLTNEVERQSSNP